MKRTGLAEWHGLLRDGQGRLGTGSGVLADLPFSVPTRFGSAAGTNPEELIAAAHAGCFSMALAYYLGAAGLRPERIRTSATLTLQNDGDSWHVPGIHLQVVARVPDTTEADFQRLAEEAKKGCLVSRLLNTNVTLEARLETAAEGSA